MAGLVLQQRVIERREQFAAVVIVHDGTDDPERLDAPINSEVVENIERRRVDRSRARMLVDDIALVEQSDGNPGAAEIELTHNWERKEPYDIGSAYGHIAIAVPDIYKTCERLAEEGVKIPRPPGPMAHGGSVIAFVEDPDGYKIELIERKPG